MIADAEVERILGKLDMRVEKMADGWRVTPPSRRFDIAIEEDLVEEVARIHGYDKVPTHAPSGELRLQPPPEAERTRRPVKLDDEADCKRAAWAVAWDTKGKVELAPVR